MQQHDEKFPEQNAPEKNTDKAFVRVGEDGEPVIPKPDQTEEDKAKKLNDEANHATTLGNP